LIVTDSAQQEELNFSSLSTPQTVQGPQFRQTRDEMKSRDENKYNGKNNFFQWTKLVFSKIGRYPLQMYVGQEDEKISSVYCKVRFLWMRDNP